MESEVKVYTYNTHFTGEIKFSHGFGMLWGFKWNQDEANKILKQLDKDVIKLLRPRMKADGLNPTKRNVYHYWNTEEYKGYDKKRSEILDKLREDNLKSREFTKILKDSGQW